MQKWGAHPFTITGISECGNVYVKDIWGKANKRSQHPYQLKPYKGTNYISSDKDVKQPVMEEISFIKSFCHQQFPSSKVSIVKDEANVSLECKKPKIDLNMPVKSIPIKILGEIEENHIQTTINESQPDEPSPGFQDFSTQNVDPDDPELFITGFITAPPVDFHPLNYVQMKRIATEVFKFDFDINQPEVQYVKCCSTLTKKSSHLIKMAGDGHCFFCSISILLTGNQFQHYKICQHLCDFIESEDNLSKLRAFLGHHNTGKDYVLSSKMRQQAWATEVEMISLALLTGKDLVCYYNQKWQQHPASSNVANPTINAFYMDNSSGCHFNAVVCP